MELYLDPVATTSRAVLTFCQQERIPVEVRTVSLMKGEHYQPAFAELNPNRLVPVLVDGDFVLTESSAILRYLARTQAPALYPSEPREAARVDELMAWFESNFYRDFGYQYVYPQLMPHHGRGSEQATAATVEFGRNGASKWLSVLDQHFLRHGGPWLTGDRLTIADFHGASILSLGELVGCDFEGYPNVQRWLAQVKTLPGWQSSHAAFEQFAQSLRGRSFVPLKARDAATA